MKRKIPLEYLATKFAAVDGYEAPDARAALDADPRRRELLLAIQAESIKDGGLAAFAEKFCQQCASRIGTPAMRNLGPKHRYTAKEREAILKEIPCQDFDFSYEHVGKTEQAQWLDRHFWKDIPIEEDYKDSPFTLPSRKICDSEFVDKLDYPAFHRLLCDFIKEFLPLELYRVATIKNAWFKPAWYCDDLVSCLMQMLDAITAQAQCALADTAVFQQTLDAVEFAIEKKVFIRLDGGPRSGKTESIRAVAAMFPGRCRLITTDCLNNNKDFFGAMADALGIDRDFKTTAPALRMKIDYIAAHCRLCWIWDEAHFLIPPAMTKSKRPSRLDWIRTHLIDRENPVVIVTTPQVYDDAARHLRDVIGYNLEQWDGRIRRHIKLPEKISAQDILAIVRKKAPALPADWQEEIAQSARLVSGSYLAAVNSMIDMAYWFAKKAGRSKPSDHDLQRAIEETVPNAAAPPEPVVPAPASPPRPIASRRGAASHPTPRRNTRPALAPLPESEEAEIAAPQRQQLTSV